MKNSFALRKPHISTQSLVILLQTTLIRTQFRHLQAASPDKKANLVTPEAVLLVAEGAQHGGTGIFSNFPPTVFIQYIRLCNRVDGRKQFYTFSLRTSGADQCEIYELDRSNAAPNLSHPQANKALKSHTQIS